ncbi:hypothetical protein AB0L44_13775 [Nonomuraea wenchangensis]|uniref:hypothetical protein n=1 Tax=Nonomuraea wenchangensis TaxID=568860 RepID=UPI003436F8B4
MRGMTWPLQRRKAPGKPELFEVPFAISCGEHVRYPLVDDVLLAVDALGIDLERDVHPMLGTGGHFRSRDAAVEPERDGCVPEVVRSPGEW